MTEQLIALANPGAQEEVPVAEIAANQYYSESGDDDAHQAAMIGNLAGM